MLFEAEATPASSALIADAAVVTSWPIMPVPARTAAAAAGRFNRVRFEEGARASATLKNGVLRIVVAPGDGLAGRPSSTRILKAVGN
jgi:hypothetical protein